MAKSKKIILAAAAFIVIILLAPIIWQNEFDKNLKVVFLDVGQGDSILIKTPAKQYVLIDGGPDNKVLNGLGKNIPFYRQKIDLMFLTHSDLDHLTGLIEVLKRYKVKSAFYNGLEDDTPEFREWLKTIKEKEIPLKIAHGGEEIKLGEDLILKTISPPPSESKTTGGNNSSIVNKLIYKNVSFLFAGDLEKEGEENLLAEKIDLKSDVLKVAHHGAKQSTSKKFLEAVRPEYAIISVGKSNKFGHPSLRVLKNLDKAGVKILRTELMGEIKISTNGKKLNFSKKQIMPVFYSKH